MKSRACKGCTMRAVGCHGKNQDGTWKCRYWGEEQEAKAAERQETAHDRMAPASEASTSKRASNASRASERMDIWIGGDRFGGETKAGHPVGGGL